MATARKANSDECQVVSDIFSDKENCKQRFFYNFKLHGMLMMYIFIQGELFSQRLVYQIPILVFLELLCSQLQ